MFWKIFLDLCLKKGVTPTAAGLEIGLNAATVSRWKRGAIPNEITLIKISKYFGVSVDYLLGKEPEEEKAPPWPVLPNIKTISGKILILKLYF